jgi:phosphatidate phosphatase APP1
MQTPSSPESKSRPPASGHLVQFFPTCGRLSAGGDYWQVAVRGRVVTPRPDNLRKTVLMRLLRRAVQVPTAEFESEIFRDRVADFLMLGLRDRNISVTIDDRLYPLKKSSKASGYFVSSIRVPTVELDSSAAQLGDGMFRSVTFEHGNPFALSDPGTAQLIPPVGPSVISDIDDTLKVTNVANRQAMLANTFLKPFEAIGRMPEQYRTWALRGTAFHYVSASPWPLFRPLREFMQSQGFPMGSFHLRPIKIQGAGPLKLVVGSKQGKRKSVRNLLRWYPHRRFILIGDSGERDMEIYGWAARRFPQQIQKICIRQVKPVKRKRLRRAFHSIPRSKWRVFDSDEELSDIRAITHVGWQVDERDES